MYWIVLGFIIASIIGFEISNPYLIVFLTLPAMIDWGTQKLSLRESINSIRLLTGFFLGVAIQYSQYLSFNARLKLPRYL